VGDPSRVSRKGKASPLEAGRGKYSPPANPERVTSEGLKRRDKGVYISKIKYAINSIGYKNIANKSQETPVLIILDCDRNNARFVGSLITRKGNSEITHP
jgi:hypothetical protein